MRKDRIEKIRAAIGELEAAQCKHNIFFYERELEDLKNQLQRETAKAA